MDHCPCTSSTQKLFLWITEFNQGITTNFLSRKSMSMYRQKWNGEEKKNGPVCRWWYQSRNWPAIELSSPSGFSVSVFNKRCCERVTWKTAVLLWENFSPPSWTMWTKALGMPGMHTTASTDKQERDQADAWLWWLTLQHTQHVSAKGKALLGSKLSTAPAENETHNPSKSPLHYYWLEQAPWQC